MYIKGRNFILHSKNMNVCLKNKILCFTIPHAAPEFSHFLQPNTAQMYYTEEEARAAFESVAEALKKGESFFELP